MEFDYKKKILDNFYNKVFPTFLMLEEERKKTLIKMILIEAFLILIPLLFYNNLATLNFFFEQLHYASWLTVFNALVIIEILVAIVYPAIVYSNFQEKLKSIAMSKVMKSFGNIKHTLQKDIFSDKELTGTGLFSIFNQNSSDDSFVGTFSDVQFRISELLLEANAGKTCFTVFKGVVCAFDSNKNFKSKTIITTKKDLDTKNNIPFAIFLFACTPLILIIFSGTSNSDIINTLQFTLPYSLFFVILGIFIVLIYQFFLKRIDKNREVSQNKIKLEDIKFNRQFNVFSDDEIEARYLITTAFMERFLNLKTTFKSKNVKCAFINNQVFFALSTKKNLFEFGNLFKPLNNIENIEFFREFFSILDLIEYFKFNEKTGL